MCCKIGNVTTRKYYVSSYIVLSCVTSYTITYIQCPTYINSRGVVLIKALTKLLQISALTVYNCFFFLLIPFFFVIILISCARSRAEFRLLTQLCPGQYCFFNLFVFVVFYFFIILSN